MTRAGTDRLRLAHFMQLTLCAHGAGRARRGPVGQIGCYDAVQASGVGNRMCGDRSGGPGACGAGAPRGGAKAK